MSKRLIDIFISIIAIILFLPFFVVIAAIVALDSRGPIIFFSERVGIKKNFSMPKFRTMLKDSPIVATHLLNSSDVLLTKSGKILRKLSLDELPQLFSVLKGDMSLVGPRPALFNQYDLINLRKKFGISELKPGITGWAQINGRDSLSILEKVEFEKEYLKKKSMFFDIKILFLTVLIVINKRDIKH